MRTGIKTIWQGKAQRLRKCKPLILGFCVIFAILVVSGSTLAWFISVDSCVNNFQTPPEKGFSAAAVDVFNPIMRPDHTWSKKVGAVNRDEKPAFIRLLVLPTFLAADKKTILPAKPATADSYVKFPDINLATWSGSAWIGGDLADGEDGYFYYLHALPGNTTTDTNGLNQNLFNTVKVSDPLPAEYKGASLRIEVKCEAVNTQKWNYRIGWWGMNTAPPGQTLRRIDAALSALAKK